MLVITGGYFRSPCHRYAISEAKDSHDGQSAGAASHVQTAGAIRITGIPMGPWNGKAARNKRERWKERNQTLGLYG